MMHHLPKAARVDSLKTIMFPNLKAFAIKVFHFLGEWSFSFGFSCSAFNQESCTSNFYCIIPPCFFRLLKFQSNSNG